jgi:hypothetical protein
MGTTDQCFKIRWLFKIQKVANPSNFQKFGKNRKILAETKLSRESIRKNLKTRNLVGLTELSTILTELSAAFSKHSVIFEKCFGPLRRFE